MNAVISLCHFCEVHGPSILFCTQAFHPEEDSQQTFDKDSEADEGTDLRSGSFLPPEGATSAPTTPTTPLPSKVDKCEACRSFLPGQTGYISTDNEAKVSYVSSQYPQHPQVYTMARQACVRSLSCEVCPGREGPIFFGDDHRGHVLSYTFFMKDSQARGFQHWYSIIIVMMDKIYLLNSWPFLVPQIEAIIKRLQGSAIKVYELEQARCPQRAQRLTMSMNPSNFLQQRGGSKPARSFTELTNDPAVFKRLHTWFTWLLKVGGNRLTERLFEGPPTEDSVIDLEKQEETEEGFVKLFSKKVTLDEEEAEGDTGSSSEEDSGDIHAPTFINVRHLLRVLGYQRFHEMAYHVMIGNQVIVKGNHKLMVKSAINCLKTLLPKGCCRVIHYSGKYEDSWRCNFLGLKPAVVVPSHVKLYLVLEIRDPEPAPSGGEVDYTLPPPTDTNEFAKYTFCIKTSQPMPEKEPAILRKMEFALMNENLADSVVEQCLVCLKEEWMNKVKVLFKFTKAGGNRSEEDTRKLMQVVGAHDEDRAVLKFWMTGLSVQYRNHTLSSAIQSVT